MMDDNEMDSAIKYALKFGEIAIMKGFITSQQLEEALDEQISHDLTHNDHILIGEILLEQKWMTPQQIAEVLEEIIKRKTAHSEVS